MFGIYASQHRTAMGGKSLWRLCQFRHQGILFGQFCFLLLPLPNNILEAPPGIEPGMEILQTSALPLGYGAISKQHCTLYGSLCQLYMIKPKQIPLFKINNDVAKNGVDLPFFLFALKCECVG